MHKGLTKIQIKIPIILVYLCSTVNWNLEEYFNAARSFLYYCFFFTLATGLPCSELIELGPLSTLIGSYDLQWLGGERLANKVLQPAVSLFLQDKIKTKRVSVNVEGRKKHSGDTGNGPETAYLWNACISEMFVNLVFYYHKFILWRFLLKAPNTL